LAILERNGIGSEVAREAGGKEKTTSKAVQGGAGGGRRVQPSLAAGPITEERDSGRTTARAEEGPTQKKIRGWLEENVRGFHPGKRVCGRGGGGREMRLVNREISPQTMVGSGEIICAKRIVKKTSGEKNKGIAGRKRSRRGSCAPFRSSDGVTRKKKGGTWLDQTKE